jgi:hypothetical protein
MGSIQRSGAADRDAQVERARRAALVPTLAATREPSDPPPHAMLQRRGRMGTVRE